MVDIASTSSSTMLSLTGMGLIVIPILVGVVCGLRNKIKGIFKIIMQKYKKDKKQYEKGQQTFKSFDSLFRKSLQDNLYHKSEHESLCNVFAKFLDET